MHNQLYIPKKLKVGFQERSDTYTKKLSFITYFNEKGEIAREKSWKGWCSSSIPSVEIENVPHEGFHLNKGVVRNGHWGDGRSMCRIYDDRGFEFEITIDNLMFILMGSDCLKRGLEGKFIYSWSGQSLVLIPENCEEYKNATKFTELQGGEVGVKDLKSGFVYRTKKVQDLIYLGRFNFYQPRYGTTSIKKGHVFVDAKGKGNYCVLANTKSLSGCITDSQVDNYAEVMDAWQKSKHASNPVSFKSEPTVIPEGTGETFQVPGSYYLKVNENTYEQYNVYPELDYQYKVPGDYRAGYNYALKGYRLSHYYTISLQAGGVHKSYKGGQREGIKTIEELNKKGFLKLELVFPSGNTFPVDTY